MRWFSAKEAAAVKPRAPLTRLALAPKLGAVLRGRPMRPGPACAALVLLLVAAAPSPAPGGSRILSCRDGTLGALTVGRRALGECDTDGAIDGRCTFSFPDFSRRPCLPLVDCPGPALVSLPVGRRTGAPLRVGPLRLRCDPAAQRETPCGPERRCDATREMCVERGPVGPAVLYDCPPVPAGCEADRRCGCAGDVLCRPPFDTCRDAGPNTVFCECVRCQ
jgi:hypothetical protein